MTFRIGWERRANTLGLDDQVAVLEGAGARLEVWPTLGFNAYRWRVGEHELFYKPETFFDEKRPTRGGFPILFPFPNRIRDGRFTWDGKTFELPKNDPTGKNGIHGFVCSSPWRIVDEGADALSTWVTGEFHGSVDAPDSLALWPADYLIQVTYRLIPEGLSVEAVVTNPDTRVLPFGLGYHPYFRLAPFGGQETLVTVHADQAWQLNENLPTGRRVPTDGLRASRIESLQLDDVLTELTSPIVATLKHPSGHPNLSLGVGKRFRELVAFTPPHREAICLEPYTCTTDSINLQQQGIDAGLSVLAPGENWLGSIDFEYARGRES